LSDTQSERLRTLVHGLAFSDDLLTPFELAVTVTIERRLSPHRQHQAAVKRALSQDLATVLSAMAYRSNTKLEEAYQAGQNSLPQHLRTKEPLSTLWECKGQYLFDSLSRIAKESSEVRLLAIQAIISVSGYDIHLNPHEQAFLRAIFTALDCSLPRENIDRYLDRLLIAQRT